MNLYISTKENLYFNPFYPNTYAALHDISFVFFSFVHQKKKVPPPPRLTMSGGGEGLGMQTYCNCWQTAVQQWPKR